MLNCSNTLAPTDELLLSLVYDEGTLSPREQAHIDQCPVCQQRLATYTSLTAALLTKLHRRLCPSAIRLNYYCLDRVPEEERVNIASHLLDCPRCADEVVEIRRVQAAFEPLPPAAPSLRTVLGRLFATLVVQQAQPVTRNDTQAAGWPRQYRAESLDLSLHLSSTSSGEYVLLGILTCTNPDEDVDVLTGAPAELYAAPWSAVAHHEKAESLPLLHTLIDDLGNVAFKPVPAGEYTMVIHLPDREMIIEGLIIEES
jgi:hypothetical protein